MNKQYRQGDVLLEATNKIPKGAKKIKLDKNYYIIKYGETTGHAHILVADNIEVYEKGEELYFHVLTHALLNHGTEQQVENNINGDDHNPIKIPCGIYKYNKQYQREYAPERIRRVED